MALFSEDQGRALVTCRPGDLDALLQLAGDHGVPAMPIGSTGGNRLSIGAILDVSLNELRAAWEARTP